MNWFYLFLIVMGILLGIIPGIITNKIKKGVELDYWERDKKFSAASGWLLVFSWVIYLTSLGAVVHFHLLQDEDIKKLEQRIEALETPPQVDTVNILDVLPKE